MISKIYLSPSVCAPRIVRLISVARRYKHKLLNTIDKKSAEQVTIRHKNLTFSYNDMSDLTKTGSIDWRELREPTEEEVSKYVFETLCDESCPYGRPEVCMIGGGCEILKKYKTGELSFRKTKEGRIIRLF